VFLPFHRNLLSTSTPLTFANGIGCCAITGSFIGSSHLGRVDYGMLAQEQFNRLWMILWAREGAPQSLQLLVP
jgi:asparagine synthetase A